MDEKIPNAARPPLSLEDAAIFDQLLDAAVPSAQNFPKLAGATELSAASSPENEIRLRHARRWLHALDTAVAEVTVPPGLALKTLAAVESDRRRVESPGLLQTMEEQPLLRRKIFGRSWGQILALALAACVAMAVVIPGIIHARQNAVRVACLTNLQALGTAFGAYGDTNNHDLPSLEKPQDGVWLPRGSTAEGSRSADAHSNTANILPMVAAGYATLDKLICPGRELPGSMIAYVPGMTEVPDQVRGYSYANLYGAIRPKWEGQTVVLADRNPLFADGVEIAQPRDNSFNHGRKGNNVLIADGSAQWADNPNVGPHGDNIWTVNYVSGDYHGQEAPRDADDVFLSP